MGYEIFISWSSGFLIPRLPGPGPLEGCQMVSLQLQGVNLPSPGNSACDLLGMVSSSDPKSKANRDLQRSGMKGSRLESPGP